MARRCTSRASQCPVSSVQCQRCKTARIVHYIKRQAPLLAWATPASQSVTRNCPDTMINHQRTVDWRILQVSREHWVLAADSQTPFTPPLRLALLWPNTAHARLVSGDRRFSALSGGACVRGQGSRLPQPFLAPLAASVTQSNPVQSAS